MVIFIKQSGAEIETNDRPESIAAGKAAGWTLKGEKKVKEVKKETKKAEVKKDKKSMFKG